MKDETLWAVQSDTSLNIEKRPLPFTSRSVYCDTSTGNPRPYIPPTMRHTIFDQFHSQAHPGGKATLWTISDGFIWPGMAADIKQWPRTCLRCQATKVGRHTRAPASTFANPDGRFTHLHTELVGPLERVRIHSDDNRPFYALASRYSPRINHGWIGS